MAKQHILLTVDNIIFTILKEKLQVVLIQRAVEPFKDKRAIPGGFVLDTETLDQAAYRELAEETNVKNVYLEQLYTFSGIKRDPRGRVVSCAYMALANFKTLDLKSGSDAKQVKLCPVDTLPGLAFDHKEIIQYALKRLKYKLEYTNVAQFLLPAEFTLSDLQQVYTVVFDQEFDTRNFRKKIEKLDIIKETGQTIIRGAHRPAMLYKFKERQVKVVEIL
jgi:8-oxo-dGTP diphosphatase